MEGVLPSTFEKDEDMHSRMREHGAAAVDQGVGWGLTQKDGLAGFSVGQEPQERWGLTTPTSSNLNTKHNKAA